MNVDYIIVGQGICGTFLSWNLLKAGKRVVVIDEARDHTASKVASGVINPVTGRRIVKTWMIDELLPFAHAQYESFGNDLDAQLVRQCNVVQFHGTPQMRDAFAERYRSDPEYLGIADEASWLPYFRVDYGLGEIQPCLLVDIVTLLSRWRKKLNDDGSLLEERFDITELHATNNGVSYKNADAQKIIFCNGADGFDLPYFSLLPYVKNKGEAIIAEIKGLPATHIYKQAFSIVPWEKDLFWIGSTYEWEYPDILPTERFRKKVAEHLNWWLRLPYTIVDHVAAVRPATVERRPFVGLHPHYPSIGILNGMGTKGCSLAPYFAAQLAEHLVNGTAISAEADVQRFRRILSPVHR